jgi:hypothetical protein
VQNCEVCSGKKWFSHIDKKTGLQRKHHIKTSDGVEYDLRIWKCWRCGNIQEEVTPFIPLHYRTTANVLYIDLEVSKSMFYSYGAKVPSTYLNIEDLIHPYFIICWSASYVGSDTVWSDCVTPKDVDGYDVKRSNTRFLLNGIEPVVGKKTIDTLKIARSKFKFESNKLDYISQVLGFRPKDAIHNSDWIEIVTTGSEKTLRKVLKYNKGDVKSGKDVLERLMKYSGKKSHWGSTMLEAPPYWMRGQG